MLRAITRSRSSPVKLLTGLAIEFIVNLLGEMKDPFLQQSPQTRQPASSKFRVKAYFPVSAVAHGLALNITILSYDGSLDYGLVSAKETMPNLRGFARHLRSAHAELLAKAGAP